MRLFFIMKKPKARKLQRFVSVSKQAKKRLGVKAKHEVLGKYPIDKHDCDCQYELGKIKKRRKTGYYTCPRSKKPGMKQYKVTCGICKATVAYVYSRDKTFADWCDLHYACEHNKEQWKGCMAVNVSPVDGLLGFECTCGNDTRDFRANTTLPSKQALEIAEDNLKGRLFDKRDSKFKVKEI